MPADLGNCADSLPGERNCCFMFLVETFVDVARFSGTSYKAAGWQYLGETQGFAKAGKNYCYHGNPKKLNKVDKLMN